MFGITLRRPDRAQAHAPDIFPLRHRDHRHGIGSAPRLWLLTVAVAALAGCGGGGKSADGDHQGDGSDLQIPSPAPVVRVDTQLASEIDTISGLDGGADRPVAALTDASGVRLHFIQDEVIVVSDDVAAVQVIAERWGGRIVRSFVPADFGLSGPAQHLVLIDTRTVDPRALPVDLQSLDPVATGELRISSEAALRLFAVAARESTAGTVTGLNLVMTPSAFRDRRTMEEPSLPLCAGANQMGCVAPGIGGAAFSGDAFTWSYMGLGPGTQDIGVGEAWRTLDLANLLVNKVRIAVIDGGFLPSEDMPSSWEHHNNSISVSGFPANTLSCNGRPCPWHGTNAVSAAMGVADDGRGAAGPAGPVAEAVTIRLSGDVFNYLGAWAIAFTSGARVLSMSFVARVPALASFVVAPLDLATRAAHEAGMLLVASAGNNNSDVDAEDCVPVLGAPCWERAWVVPCENGGVLCVGSLEDNATQRRSSSNYGEHDVDLFGPGSVWVGGDGADPEPHVFSGTSAAAPFVAGVGALVMAANPELSGKDVARILTETAHPSPDGGVRRYVNAFGAVLQALGGAPACLLPEFTLGPVSRDTPPCLANTFTASVRDESPFFGPFQFVWRRYLGDTPVELVDDTRISGSRTEVLTIDPFRAQDAGTYDVLATNPCGSRASGRAFVRILDGAFQPAFDLLSGRTAHAMAFDSVRGRMVVHGGVEWIRSAQGSLVGLDVKRTTLERDGAGAWSVVASQTPPPRLDHALAYDERRGVTVLFGGRLCDDTVCAPGNPGGELIYGDTWEWDGNAWAERTPVIAPPARSIHAMTYDPVRQRVVLHGGRGRSGSQLGDLWEWDGATWTERAPIGDPTPGSNVLALGHPRPRENHSLAFDRARNVLMLHGGIYRLALPEHAGGDTWELAGDQWRRVAVAGTERPGLVFTEAMAFAADRGRMLLYTQNNGGSLVPGMLWEWSGTQWLPKATLPFRYGTTMAYDSARQRVTLAGGQDTDGLTLAQVWDWRYFDEDPMCSRP